MDQVQTLFNASGVESVYEKVDNVTVLSGYYPCDAPPQLGFQFPSFSNRTAASQNYSSPVSHTGKVFNILPEGLQFNATGNRCRSVIQGYEGYPNWLAGQCKYIPPWDPLRECADAFDSLYGRKVY